MYVAELHQASAERLTSHSWLPCSSYRSGPSQQQQVLFRDEAPFEQVALHEPQPLRPVGAAGLLQQDDRLDIALARLHQRQQFESLVQRPEPAGQQRKGVRLLEKRHLAREEVLEIDKLG